MTDTDKMLKAIQRELHGINAALTAIAVKDAYGWTFEAVVTEVTKQLKKCMEENENVYES